MRTLRRVSQVLFLGLFLLFLCTAAFRNPFLETDAFVALTNALATRALYRGLLWCLVIIIPTMFLGRFFCGWICPLGTLNHWAGNIRSAAKSGRRRIDSNRYRPWQTLKYYFLVALLAAALLGTAIGGLFDPIVVAARSFALSVLPAGSYSLAHAGPLSYLLISPQAQFRQGFLFGVLLIFILALNLRITRFWCRALCPLGALLGLVGRWSILGLDKDGGECGDCNRCLLHCQGGDDPIPGARWHKPECHLCMNCVADCPESGIRFRFFPRASATTAAPNLVRRKLLTGVAAGAAAVPLLRANTGLDAEPHPRRIRPPAAMDERLFLARCIRCAECIRVCPSHGLQPALAEAGWEGIWTPVLAPRIGYCEPGCALCGQVCPTGAIWQFTTAEKGWAGAAAHPIRLGTAFYDRGRCLPWAMATECIVCEEWCPTSPKAIYLRPAEVTDAAGNTKQLQQPYLDPGHCVGCGACEFACPVKGTPAIYVTSVGESRSTTNQILLRRAPQRVNWLPETGDAPGWTRTGEAREFEAADLWKYIDGDAERYLRAGVRRTLTANYRYQDGVEAAVDIHLMASPAAARALFDSEPAIGSRPAAVGDAARNYGQSLTFRRGAFFVRLVGYAPQTESALLVLAHAVASRLRAN